MALALQRMLDYWPMDNSDQTTRPIILGRVVWAELSVLRITRPRDDLAHYFGLSFLENFLYKKQFEVSNKINAACVVIV